MKEQEKTIYVPNLFEFVFYINNQEDGTICSREFTLNDFNPDSVNSYGIKEMMDIITGMNNPDGTMGIIPSALKEESKQYSWKHYGWRYYANSDDVESEINRHEADINTEEKENYFFEVRKVNIRLFGGYPKRGKNGKFIRYDDRPTTLIGASTFDANVFPRKVRHFVDIRDKFPEIIDTIAAYLTTNDLEMSK